MRIWSTLRTDGRIVRDAISEFDYKSIDDVSDINALLKDICYELDLACPVLLSKHVADLHQFGHTSFKTDDFMEPVAFDRLEIELLRDKKADGKNSQNR